MNVCVLMGRTTREPEIRQAGETTIAKFTLAVDRRFKREGGDTTDFINCICFRRTAEFVEKWVQKGTKILVQGSIQTGSYTNRDGRRVLTTDVVVDNVEFAESLKSQTQPSAQKEETADMSEWTYDDLQDIEGLPFK